MYKDATTRFDAIFRTNIASKAYYRPLKYMLSIVFPYVAGVHPSLVEYKSSSNNSKYALFVIDHMIRFLVLVAISDKSAVTIPPA